MNAGKGPGPGNGRIEPKADNEPTVIVVRSDVFRQLLLGQFRS